MNRCERCPSQAINDDPTETLCDCCWRDAKLETLRAEILVVLIHLDTVVICRDAKQFRRCRDKLRALAMGEDNDTTS